MKLFLLSFAIFVALSFGVSSIAGEAKAAADAAKPVVAPAAPASKAPNSPGACVVRGFANIGTGWIEIARCAFYDNCLVPGVGLGVGAGEGAGYTMVRLFTGMADVFSLGFAGDSFYGDGLPDFVWEAHWLPVSFRHND